VKSATACFVIKWLRRMVCIVVKKRSKGKQAVGNGNFQGKTG